MMLTGPDCTTGAVKFPGGVGFTDDMVVMPLQCATQWDALSHCFLDGQLYNGYDANEVSSRGARRLGIEKVARGVAGRGVLVDLPRANGLDWLEPGYAITADDLDAGLEAEHVDVRAGDILLVRTGMIGTCHARGGWGDYAGGPAPSGVDVVFENVGGNVFDMAFGRMNVGGRIALCGLIAGYDGQDIAIRNVRSILINRLSVTGFIVSDHAAVWPQALQELSQLVAAGTLKYRESIATGIENAPKAFIGLLKGENFGKQLVKL